MKIGILNAYHYDTTPGVYQEKYAPMFLSMMKVYWPNVQPTEFLVARGQFPDPQTDIHAWIITGSPKSSYDDEPWVSELKNLIRKFDSKQTRLIGLCFGHQIIAEALGGKVEKSQKGWGVGVREFDILSHQDWMRPSLQKCSLLFSHQDQVVSLPPSVELLASDPFCPIQMYSKGRHIFSMQGHPEFTAEYARERLDTRIERVGRKRYEEALATLNRPTNADTVWQWMYNFLECD